MSIIDQPSAVRPGEALDVAAIDRYLRAELPELEGEKSGLPEVSQFPGGASNLTYLVSYSERQYVLRRPPFGTVAKSAHDMTREAKIMRALGPVYPYVPAIKVICEGDQIIGSPFYLMQRFAGIIPRVDMPTELCLDKSATRKLCCNVLDCLIELHQIDFKAHGLAFIGKGSGYVERQISGWGRRFEKAHTNDVGDFSTVMKWLSENQPEDAATCVIHNDFRFDNLVLDPADPLRVVGVLDWEMATLGDPLMDLGNTLAYWVEADDEPAFQMLRRQPTHLPGMLTRAEVMDYYFEHSDLDERNFDFYEIYGLFRLAVIVQQIYFRFHRGQTQDQRFAKFGRMVAYLEQRCLRRIELSGL